MKKIWICYMAVVLVTVLSWSCDVGGTDEVVVVEPEASEIVKGWKKLAGERAGKVVFANPPKMMILDLTTGKKREVPGVITAGAPGRRRRGKSPRPFWAPDGKRFVYRYNGNVFVSDEQGKPVGVGAVKTEWIGWWDRLKKETSSWSKCLIRPWSALPMGEVKSRSTAS
jgi:hypothetical protein